MGSEIKFKGYEQHQGQLFPAHLSEALDPGDPVFFISDLVEGLDLVVFEPPGARTEESTRILWGAFEDRAGRGGFSSFGVIRRETD